MKIRTLRRVFSQAAALLFTGFAANSGSAEDFVLAEPGTAPAPLMLYPGAPERTRDAAVTLADYIEKICGQRPELVEETPDPLPERAVWVGVQPALQTLLPNLKLDFDHPEEILLATDGRHLVIAGRDRWLPGHTEAKGRLAMRTGLQQEYGTANAIYTFLQNKLHVRWLWPGEEDLLRKERLALAPFEYRYHPQIRSRSGMFKRLSLGDSKEGQDEIWARLQRVQLNSLELPGGHAFSEWWEKYHQTHPDYFALYPDGTRSPHSNPRNTKLCASNPAVWQQWLEEVEEQLQADPTQRVFNAAPNDGYDYGHCVCEGCVAWDQPEAKKFTWRWKGEGEERPALSDRDVTFANTLARLLKKRYPDKDLYVMVHAYGYSRPAPLKAVPDTNVLVSNVANFHMRGDGSQDGRDTAMQEYEDWARLKPQMAWRPNLGNPAGLSWGMPDVAMTQAGEDFRFVAERGCIGLFMDMFWFHWATQGPHYYVLAHLAWNPFADVERLMDDYYERGYGPAASEVKAYWQFMEQTRMEFVREHPSRMRAFNLPEKYTPERLAKARGHLDAAASRLDGADDKYARRLAFIRYGLDYAELVVETRRWMQIYENSKLKDRQARDQVLACWQRAETLKSTAPEFAINWAAVFRDPGADKGDASRRVQGLHPKVPLSGRTLKELQGVGLE